MSLVNGPSAAAQNLFMDMVFILNEILFNTASLPCTPITNLITHQPLGLAMPFQPNLSPGSPETQYDHSCAYPHFTAGTMESQGDGTACLGPEAAGC